MHSFDCAERPPVAVREGASDRARACELGRACVRAAHLTRVRRSAAVQVANELLVEVAPFVLGRERAEAPGGHREWQRQEEQCGGEPQTAAGEPPYRSPFPLPLPWSRLPWSPLPWSSPLSPPLPCEAPAGEGGEPAPPCCPRPCP